MELFSSKGHLRIIYPIELEIVPQPEFNGPATVGGCGQIIVVLVEQIIARRKQIGVVKGVEEFRPESKRLMFEPANRKREGALDTGVEVPLTRSVHGVTPGVAEA